MAVITTEHIAIAELVIYIPVAILTIFVVFRHGFHKQLGWIYLAIFSGIRIGGAVMEILSHKNPGNANDKEWALILQSVGLSPLLLSTLGLLKRIATAASRRSKLVQLLHIPALIALILAISGGTDQASSDASDQASGKTETQAAIIIYLIVYIVTCFLWVISVKNLQDMQSSQKRMFFCVFIALPLIACRLIYSLISDFGHNSQFSLVDGDPRIQLAMATIEELIVVFIYTILGLVTPRSTISQAVGGGKVPAEARAYTAAPVYDNSSYLQNSHSQAQQMYPQQYAEHQYRYPQSYSREG
ncbi:hypothetical protein N7495_002147 [Penicillium taxi]|uniref:uncharacterized protein n=1 Tax=Penicillium taxi TaxID=168475 RepID=UPI0025457450|nr:uncharacterized protein N7495_002147 [Penicillium taxi]KAJ5901619.1 hypothetical protein N7495_002147 [Penicillium taxi]